LSYGIALTISYVLRITYRDDNSMIEKYINPRKWEVKKLE